MLLDRREVVREDTVLRAGVEDSTPECAVETHEEEAEKARVVEIAGDGEQRNGVAGASRVLARYRTTLMTVHNNVAGWSH